MTQFEQGMMVYYQGELLSEVVFEQLLEVFTQPQQQTKLAALLQLETETKARLRPAMMELGLPLTEQDDSRKRGLEMANALAGINWLELMNALCAELPPAVERYKQIAAGAPPSYRSLAESMVTNEQALLDFAELEKPGKADRSLNSILPLLHFTLSPSRQNSAELKSG